MNFMAAFQMAASEVIQTKVCCVFLLHLKIAGDLTSKTAADTDSSEAAARRANDLVRPHFQAMILCVGGHVSW